MQKMSLALKERYVLNKFTEYLYHQMMYETIQYELIEIDIELSGNKLCNSELTSWKKELLSKETELLCEQNYHKKELDLVNLWLSELNENQRNILIAYAINNGCKNGTKCGVETNNTESNIYKTTKRVVTKLAKKI